MKAVILASDENALLSPVAHLCHKSMVPFLNRPFLEYQIRQLQQNGISEIGIALSPQHAAQVIGYFGDGEEFGLKINCIVDTIQKGPGACLKLFERFVRDEPFLALNGNVYLGSINLSDFVDYHHGRKAAVTLGMYREPTNGVKLKKDIISPGGGIQRFEIPESPKNGQRHDRFSGIYLFDHSVLGLIRNNGYNDIKEQLIPELRDTGHLIVGHPIKGFFAVINDIQDYYRVQCDILHRGSHKTDGYIQANDNVWIEKDTQISPSAHISGPAVIGKNCIIEDEARIIGPVVIGDHCRIERESLIRESIVWSNIHISKRSRNEYSIIGTGYHNLSDQRVDGAVLMPKHTPVKYRFTGNGHKLNNMEIKFESSPSRLAHRMHTVAKRILDVGISLLGSVICAPLFLLIALAIKVDSSGPVFYIQRRCGKNGKEFQMIKFRTMVPEAEKWQKKYEAQKDVDGPIFKLRDDPRLTTIGKSLRMHSLDELPQVFNVLKGDMSLVGPRPLIMEEMRFNRSWRDLRLSVKPGVTGLWQVNGRSQNSFHDWVKYDIAYVRNQNLWLDLKILCKTPWAVLKRTGAF